MIASILILKRMQEWPWEEVQLEDGAAPHRDGALGQRHHEAVHELVGELRHGLILIIWMLVMIRIVVAVVVVVVVIKVVVVVVVGSSSSSNSSSSSSSRCSSAESSTAKGAVEKMKPGGAVIVSMEPKRGSDVGTSKIAWYVLV